jgi:hypothetical protein
MFPYSDPQTQLDLHRQRVDELIREAAADRLARTASAGRHRRSLRWRRAPGGTRTGGATAAA